MNKKGLVIDKYKIKEDMPVSDNLLNKSIIVVMVSYLLCLLLIR
jgi:hypothetical protein